MTEYSPGICNIGTQEIKKRRQVGIIGIAIALIYLLFLLLSHINPSWRFLIFLPLFFASSGFLQAKMHFCSGYGLRGEYNVSKKVGDTDKIKNTEFIKKDKQKALRILYIAALIAIIITTIVYFI